MEEALKRLVNEWLANIDLPVGLQAQVEVRGERKLSPAIEGVFLRIAQEALANIARHSQAHNVVVRLLTDLPEAILEVQDDGIGFDPAIEKPGRKGLIAMHKRAARAGVELTIESEPGKGTLVRARWPRGDQTWQPI